MIYPARKHSSIKVVALAVVLVIHFELINHLIHTKLRKILQPVATSIKIRILDDIKVDSEKLLPLPLNFEIPTTAVAFPDIYVAAEQDAAKTPPLLQLATNRALTIAVPTIATTGPRPDPNNDNHFPIDAYPAAAKSADLQGTVTLSLQVLENGRVNDAQIEKSSGFELLDQAAAHYARSHWRFIPGTRNGEAAIDWRTVSVVFTANQVTVRY